MKDRALAKNAELLPNKKVNLCKIANLCIIGQTSANSTKPLQIELKLCIQALPFFPQFVMTRKIVYSFQQNP